MHNLIHISSDVQSSNIGEGTYIWQYCVVLKGATIGKNCNINCQVFIENNVVIGDNVTIKPGVQIWDGITIGNDVFIGPNVSFTNDLVPRSKLYPDVFTATKINDGASIGANSTILAGIEIGQYALVGAASLVSKNIPPYTLWYGVPATHKGYVTRKGVTINMDFKDKQGNNYILVDFEPIIKS